MSAFAEIFIYVIQTLGYLYLTVVLLRFLLQVARADFYNPISQAVVKATNPLLKPLRKVVPGVFGIDLACLVLALLVQLLVIELVFLIAGGRFANPLTALSWSFIGCLSLVLNIFFFGLIISIIFSWIAPYSRHPALMILNQLMEPALAPFRKIIPSLGGLDITPIFAFLVINVLKIVVRHMAVAAHMPSLFYLGF